MFNITHRAIPRKDVWKGTAAEFVGVGTFPFSDVGVFSPPSLGQEPQLVAALQQEAHSRFIIDVLFQTAGSKSVSKYPSYFFFCSSASSHF